MAKAKSKAPAKTKPAVPAGSVELEETEELDESGDLPTAPVQSEVVADDAPSDEDVAVAIYAGVRLPGSCAFGDLDLRDRERYRATARNIRTMLRG